jgi:glycosyltransferase involved in cell wall biosynthesis
MRVAIAHEWLVRYAGSERVVEELLAAYPGSRLLATVVDPEDVPEPLRGAEPSFLQRLPGATDHHEWLLPLMPLAWRSRKPVDDVDAVISSSHACANAVRVAPGIPHLAYSHTPMRYAWDFQSERDRFPAPIRPAAQAGMTLFRRWDRRTAQRITRFVANSSAVAERIRRFYGRQAEVVPPPVRTEFFTPGGERGADFLYVGRLVGYKRPDLAVDAFAGLPHRLLVVGDGQLAGRLRERAPANVEFLGEVDDERLRELYRSSRALVYPGEEDFGIVMAEAQATGTPVIGLARGGATDIVEDGETGWLVREQTVGDLREAIGRAAIEQLDGKAISERAQRFSRERFRERIRAVVEAMVADPRKV